VKRPVPPMSTDARARAAAHFRVAACCANELTRGHSGRDFDDIHGEALYALCRAAMAFDPNKGHRGERGFGQWAVQCVRRHLWRHLGIATGEQQRRAKREARWPSPKRQEGVPLDRRPAEGEAADVVAERAELVALALAAMTPLQRRLAELQLSAGLDVAGAGQALGLKWSTAWQLRRRGVERARQALGVAG
jgi:DNA-directed RNA polymerase specialized sigma24 family protein